jgi:hypothetical protein
VVGLFKNGTVSHALRLSLFEMITRSMETHRYIACLNYPKRTSLQSSETQYGWRDKVYCNVICTVLGLVTKYGYNVYVSGHCVLSPVRTFWINCPASHQTPPQFGRRIVGRTLLCSVDTSLCPVLSDIMLQLFPSCYRR